MTNILALLLVSQTCAEWVEISQQHYRKPIRTLSPFSTPDKEIDVEDISKPWTYNNRSVTEYNWNKSPARTPNLGNVKRVQLIGSTAKTTERVVFKDDDHNLGVDIIDYELKPNDGATKTTIEFNDYGKQKGTIARVSNLGNIKRVQLNSSPVKSPAVNFKRGGVPNSNNRYVSVPYDDMHAEINEFEAKKRTETFNRRIYVNEVKKHHSTEKPATFPPDDDANHKTSYIEEVTTFKKKGSKQTYNNHTAVNNLYITMPTFITETGDFNNYETKQNRFYKITNSQSSEVTEKVSIFTTENVDTDEEYVTKSNLKITTLPTEKPSKNNVFRNINKNGNDFEAESHENNIQVSRNDEKQTNVIANDLKTNMKANVAKTEPHAESENRFQKENKDKKKDGTPKGVKPESNKVNTMENVIKFMRVVADNISRNSRRSFGGKMQYLHELKDSILANIEERIDSTWPDDDNVGAHRRSRSAKASPRGHHVQLPSSESALMTISFLTFAVFLIKLVLQVIQTYKHKTMMVTPLVVASGRNAFTQHGQD